MWSGGVCESWANDVMPPAFNSSAIFGPTPSIFVKSSPASDCGSANVETSPPIKPELAWAVAPSPANSAPRSPSEPDAAIVLRKSFGNSAGGLAESSASGLVDAADSKSGKLLSSDWVGCIAASRIASRLYWTSESWKVRKPVPAGIKWPKITFSFRPTRLSTSFVPKPWWFPATACCESPDEACSPWQEYRRAFQF